MRSQRRRTNQLRMMMVAMNMVKMLSVTANAIALVMRRAMVTRESTFSAVKMATSLS